MWYIVIFFYKPRYSVILRSERNKCDFDFFKKPINAERNNKILKINQLKL